MGIGADYIQAWNTERPATFNKSLESVSCWIMDVWKIQIENEKLEYISVRDGKTRSLRIINNNKIITYSTLPTVYYARVKQWIMPRNPPNRDIEVNQEQSDRHDKTKDLERFAQSEEDQKGRAADDVDLNNRRSNPHEQKK